MFSDDDGSSARVGVRIGDSVLDLARALGDEVFGEPSLNAFMAQGRARWAEARARGRRIGSRRLRQELAGSRRAAP